MNFEAKLCSSVEGVMFTARHAGRTVRCLILREALEQVFGASEEPASWLQAYHRHAGAIERMASERYLASPGPALLLFPADDFAHAPPQPEPPAHNARLQPRPFGKATTVSPWG